MGSKKDVSDRRARVFQLVNQGFTQAAIAKQFNVSTVTIESDLREIRKEVATKYQSELGWARVSEYNEAQRLRVQRLWAIVTDKKSSTRDVIRALRELREEEAHAIKKDQIVGILPRGPEEAMQPLVTGDNSQVQVQHVNIYQTLLKITQAEKDIQEGKVLDVKKKPEKKAKTKTKTKKKDKK